MVSFAAQEQDIQPANTAFWARPIREPKVDVSKETLGKTVGSAINEGIKFADDYVREGIVAPTTETEAGKLRDQFVDALNTASNSVEPQPLGSPKSLSESEQRKLPQTIQNTGDKVDILQKAMESGRLSETDYYGRVNALAKQLRSQYPGYRDEVDRQIARVTGVHSANAQIRSQIQDLNRLVAQHGEKKDKFDTLVQRAVFSGIGVTDDQLAHWQKMHADNPDKFGVPEVLREINRMTFNKGEYERKREAAFDQTQDAKQSASNATSALTGAVGSMLDDIIHTEKISVGVYSGQSMDDYLTAYSQGRAEMSDVDATEQGRREQVRYNQVYAQAQALANRPDPDDPQHRTYAQLIGKGGEKSVKEILDSAFEGWRKRVDAFAGKDPIMANVHTKLVEASKGDNENNIRKSDPAAAAMGDMAEMLRKQYGPNADMLITTSPLWNAKTVPSLQGMFDQAWLAARVQPRLNAGGQPYEFINDVRNYANQTTDDPNYVRTLARGIDEFNAKDTDPQTRKSLAYYFFGPKSGELVVNGGKGTDIVYSQFYTPLSARTMAKYNPDLYPMFEQGAEQNAKALFTTNINNLKAIGQRQVPGTATIQWNSVTSKFDVGGEGQNFIKDDVDKVNTMIHGLKSVYDADPHQKVDVETFMFERLVQMGFDPNKNVSGLPEQFMKALMASRGASKATEKPTGASKSNSGTGVAE